MLLETQWFWKYVEAKKLPYDSKIGTDNRMVLVNSKDGTAVVIKRIGPEDKYRTL